MAENRASGRNDAHTHIWAAEPPVPALAPAGVDGSAVRLLAEMDRAGVGRAAVITPRSMGWDDSITLAAAREHPERLVAVIRHDITDPQAPQRTREKLDAGARGVRIASDDGPLARFLEPEAVELWRLLAESGVPLAINAAHEELAVVDELLRLHPEVTVLLDHAGRPDVAAGVDDPRFRSVLGWARFENLHLKTPDAPYFSRQPHPFPDLGEFVAAALAAFGAHRVLWASDWPLCTAAHPYESSAEPTAQAVAGLSDADAELVLAGNFERLYGRG